MTINVGDHVQYVSKTERGAKGYVVHPQDARIPVAHRKNGADIPDDYVYVLYDEPTGGGYREDEFGAHYEEPTAGGWFTTDALEVIK